MRVVQKNVLAGDTLCTRRGNNAGVFLSTLWATRYHRVRKIHLRLLQRSATPLRRSRCGRGGKVIIYVGWVDTKQPHEADGERRAPMRSRSTPVLDDSVARSLNMGQSIYDLVV